MPRKIQLPSDHPSVFKPTFHIYLISHNVKPAGYLLSTMLLHILDI